MNTSINTTEAFVEYVRDREGEDPFLMNGQKYQFVTSRNSRGNLDIGVYAFAGDVTYSYSYWREIHNLK
jgi:hypothetical protein